MSVPCGELRSSVYWQGIGKGVAVRLGLPRAAWLRRGRSATSERRQSNARTRSHPGPGAASSARSRLPSAGRYCRI